MVPVLPITLAIVHAQELVRQGIKLTLEGAGLAKVVLELAHPSALLAQWPAEGVQVLLLYLGHPLQDAFDTVATLRQRFAGTAVLLIGELTPVTAYRAVAAGATGLLHSEAPCTEVQQAIEVGAKGGIHNNAWYREAMRGKRGAQARQDAGIHLTSMEQRVLRLMCRQDCPAYAVMAAELGKSVRTVETHRDNLFRKFGVNTRGALVNKVRSLGLG